MRRFTLAAAAAFAAAVAMLESCGTLTAAPDDVPADASTEAATASEGGASVDESLLLYMPFDEGTGTATHEATKSGISGLLQPGATWGDGKRGKAVVLDGKQGFVVLSGTKLDLTKAFTVSIWVNLRSAADQRIVSVPYAWEVKTNGGHPQLDMRLGNGTDFTESTEKVPVGGFHHLAMTFDHGAVVFFLDGVKTATLDSSIDGGTVLRPADSDVILLGIDFNREAFWVDGSLDELRIYDRALTPAEVAALAQ